MNRKQLDETINKMVKNELTKKNRSKLNETSGITDAAGILKAIAQGLKDYDLEQLKSFANRHGTSPIEIRIYSDDGKTFEVDFRD